MAAGLRPDPLGELKRSPDLLAAIRGVLLRRGQGRGGEGRGAEKGRGNGKGRGNLLQAVRGDRRPCQIV